MKLGIMQPYFLPYIGYWQLLNAVDKYIIYDDVNYIKGGWINRNRILVGKEPKFLTMRLNGASPNKKINEIELLNDKIYKNKLIKTIEESYKKAPYFNEVIEIVKKILNCEERNLAKFIENSIKEICKYLEIKTEIIISSNLKKKNEVCGEERVLEICKLLNATEYYNAIGGQELYSFEKFQEKEVKLKFLKTNRIEYKQFKNEFIENLSILDVMMFNSIEEIKILLENYNLIGE